MFESSVLHHSYVYNRHSLKQTPGGAFATTLTQMAGKRWTERQLTIRYSVRLFKHPHLTLAMGSSLSWCKPSTKVGVRVWFSHTLSCPKRYNGSLIAQTSQVGLQGLAHKTEDGPSLFIWVDLRILRFVNHWIQFFNYLKLAGLKRPGSFANSHTLMLSVFLYPSM